MNQSGLNVCFVKLTAHHKADICNLTGIAIALCLMAPLPRLLAQSWWGAYLNTPVPDITWDLQVIWAAGFFLTIAVGALLPEQILNKAHREKHW